MHPSHQDARALFDATVDDYARRAERGVHNFSSLIFQRRIDIVDRFLDSVPRDGAVLDFGMGPAVFGPACVARGLRYTGIDISPEMVAHAKTMKLPGAELLVGDLESLASCRGSKDAVMAIGLLDYLEHPGAGIQALAACVKPGGLIALSFRNRRSVPRALRDLSKRAWRALSGSKIDNHGRAFFSDVHEHSFDFQHDLQPELARCGFGHFRVEYFNCSPFFSNFPLPKNLWERWRAVDALVAGPRTSMLCSGGVLVARAD